MYFTDSLAKHDLYFWEKWTSITFTWNRRFWPSTVCNPWVSILLCKGIEIRNQISLLRRHQLEMMGKVQLAKCVKVKGLGGQIIWENRYFERSTVKANIRESSPRSRSKCQEIQPWDHYLSLNFNIIWNPKENLMILFSWNWFSSPTRHCVRISS